MRTYQGYWHFLVTPWKLATFGVSSGVLLLLVPLAHDVTWDYATATFMAVLTFATAPWAAGVFFRAAKGVVPALDCLPAFCSWMFSASWAYDIYLVGKLGFYPPTWLPNLLLSGLLYVAAGLFWNLSSDGSGGVAFAFSGSTWPSKQSRPSWLLLALSSLPFLVVYAYVVIGAVPW